MTDLMINVTDRTPVQLIDDLNMLIAVLEVGLYGSIKNDEQGNSWIFLEGEKIKGDCTGICIQYDGNDGDWSRSPLLVETRMFETETGRQIIQMRLWKEFAEWLRCWIRSNLAKVKEQTFEDYAVEQMEKDKQAIFDKYGSEADE